MTIHEGTTEKTEDIRKKLKELKDGVWFYELARRCKVPEGSIRYLVLGQEKKDKPYGGYLKNEIEIVGREGRNLKIRLKH